MARSDTRQGQRPIVGYLLAVVACAAAVLVQLGLEPVLGNRFPFAVFSAAVAVAAWSGGPGPGLLATLAGAMAGNFVFVDPQRTLAVQQPSDILALALFALTGILISLSTRRLRRQAWSERHARAETERQLRHTALLEDLTAALSRAKTPADVSRACLVEVLHAANATAGALLAGSDDGTGYDVVTAVGLAAGPGPAQGIVTPGVRALVTEAVRGQELLVVDAHQPALHDLTRRDLTAGVYETAIVIPLSRAGRAGGAILLTFDAPRGVPDDERLFLLAVGSRTAQALDRAWLYEAAERARAEAEHLRARADVELRERQRAEEALRESETKYRGLAARTNRLYELSTGLSEAVSVAAVTRVIVGHGKVVVGASAASVITRTADGQAFETLYAEGYPRHLVEAWKHFPTAPGLLVAAAAESRQPVLVPTFSELQKHYPASIGIAADGGFTSAAALPLLVENAVTGVLVFHFTAPVNFDAEYSALLLSVAQHCAQALDRARLYESAQNARRVAEDANRSKDEFLSIVSHELRTPLNAMLGWASLLRSGKLEASRTTRAIDAIFTNATRQAHLIEELLDVSRIVAGRAPIDPEPVDLGENIRGAVEAVMPLADAKGLVVHLEPIARVSVWADPRRLEQVFLNLLSNAVKFTPAGGRVTIAMEADDGSASVRVTDTGDGMEAAFLPHVFERFRQADSTMARSVGGLGLGLFIARRLVEAHGGWIRADSDGPGRGSTFTVSLPKLSATRATGEPKSALGRDRGDRTDAAPHLAGIRVLLVDDEPDAREVMASALEACGATVLAAASAADALATLGRTPVDVLLSDLAMPGKDGYELIREIRSLSPAPYASVPAAAVTASARDDERQRALMAGFQVHLPKPVRPVTLAQTVALLARQQAVADSKALLV
ncbi:MAG: ATP-binding protein [Vicinamibacterales bacterium]